MIRKKKKKKSKLQKTGIAFCLLFILVIIFFIIYSNHKIEHVFVEGNVYYTEEEIKNFVLQGDYTNNSLYLSLKYKNKVITDIPFIERLEVRIDEPDTVHIQVYEKRLAGYVTYLGENVYFDKDGIVVECTELITETIPHITGLHFSHMVLYDELQVEEENVFIKILDITKTLQKYQLEPTEIYFTSKQEVTLFFEQVRIQVGETEYLDEKFGFIKEILPNLIGKKGEISLKKYKGEAGTISFTED